MNLNESIIIGSFFISEGETLFMLNNTYMIMCEVRVNST